MLIVIDAVGDTVAVICVEVDGVNGVDYVNFDVDFNVGIGVDTY